VGLWLAMNAILSHVVIQVMWSMARQEIMFEAEGNEGILSCDANGLFIYQMEQSIKPQRGSLGS
jgi:hypothetical protein